MSESVNSFSVIKQTLLGIKPVELPTFNRLGIEILTDKSSDESKLIQNVTSLDIRKKSVSYFFDKSYFVNKIELKIEGSVFPSSGFDIVLFGGQNEGTFHVTQSFLDSNKAIAVNGSILGFKIISKKNLGSVISEISVFGCASDEYLNLLDIINNQVKSVNSVHETTLASLNTLELQAKEVEKNQNDYVKLKTEIDANAASKAKLEEEISDLNEEKKSLLEENAEVIEKNEKLQRENQSFDANIYTAKKDFEDLKSDVSKAKKELNELQDKKTFYNETLEGRRRESLSKFLINLGLALALLLLIAEAADYIFTYSSNALQSLPTNTDIAYLIAYAIVKIAPAILFVYFIRYAFLVLAILCKNIHIQIMDTLSIETKLNLVRFLSDNIFKKMGDEYTGEEKRKFTAALTMFIMKDHMMINSPESLAFELDLDDNKIKPLIAKFLDTAANSSIPSLLLSKKPKNIENNKHLDS